MSPAKRGADSLAARAGLPAPAAVQDTPDPVNESAAAPDATKNARISTAMDFWIRSLARNLKLSTSLSTAEQDLDNGEDEAVTGKISTSVKTKPRQPSKTSTSKGILRKFPRPSRSTSRLPPILGPTWKLGTLRGSNTCLINLPRLRLTGPRPSLLKSSRS